MTSPGSARSARAAAFSVDDGLLRDSEHPSIKRRSVSANILLARDFASCSVAEKIGRFLQENLQETASFPSARPSPSCTAPRSRCASPVQGENRLGAEV